jgi:peptide/nickel transport system permease protein
VIVGVAAITYVMLQVLRPERFPDPRPLPTELWEYLWNAFVHFDLGRSTDNRLGTREVAVLVREGLPGDIALLAGGVFFGIAAGIAGGAVCAARPGSFVSWLLQFVALIALCAPVYWVGLMSARVFSPDVGPIGLPFFPLPGTYRPLTEDPLAWLHALAIPWIVVGAPIAAMCLRMTRAQMQETMQADYVRTAVAKGLARRTVVRRHAVPPASSAALTLTGAQMATFVTNVLLVEQVFNIPGVFRLTTRAMASGDFPVLQGIVICGAVLVVVASVCVDIALAWIDPRVRLA